MKVLRILMLTLAATLLALGLWGCGSSGSGTPAVVDRDGDGIPNVDDAFPDDPLRFAAFESDTDTDPFSVVVAVAENGNSVLGGQSDLVGNTLLAQRLTFDPVTEIVTQATLNPIGGVAANQNRAYSAVYGVNADGLAVGESSLLDSDVLNFVPVFWAADSVDATRLPLTQTEGEIIPPAEEGGEPEIIETVTTFTNGSAYGVNTAGQIVGEIMTDNGLMAVLWQPDAEAVSGYAEPVTLSSLMENGSATAHYINADGLVVGEAMTSDGMRAALWTVSAAGSQQGDAIDLGTLSINHVASSAYGVDSLGRIVGESVTGTGIVHAALWRAHSEDAEDLGENSSAMAISAANNRIVGSAMVDGEMRAAVWDTRSTVLSNSDAVLTEGPTFTPLAGNSRAYAQSQGEVGAVGGLYVDHAFIAVPIMPQ
ncbi:hypothetical protein [Geoalkalibacter halelectricus]|uniref:Extracellular repeat, HAF family n=1 Tax=Geoalkalibacter halelectricus TaxID=2847045 RepID=A0ABY5ZRK4_9BACT|nr:hypothetical protein [Geoalkalibacter halelectricus]MDO3378366.1 hypothetical protein [Geoalkalibacter halelectricus]UWZ80314.1 hypothetical protein L9S41_02665 [Geoalkalibacter halelectricus]